MDSVITAFVLENTRLNMKSSPYVLIRSIMNGNKAATNVASPNRYLITIFFHVYFV